MKVEFLHANVNPSSSDEPIVPHERTTDLIGKRVKYTYSSKHVYEHIYLNDRFFTCIMSGRTHRATFAYFDTIKLLNTILEVMCASRTYV